MKKLPVLIIGLFDTAIMTARCFRKTGIEVYGLDYEQQNNGFYSNAIKSFKISSPFKNEAKWIEELLIWLKTANQKFVLIPTSDEFVLLASKYKNKLSEYTLSILPDYEILLNIVERDTQFHSAMKCGLKVPPFIKGSITDVSRVALSFPLAIKPLNSPEWKSHFNNKGFVVNNPEEFKTKLDLVNNSGIRYLLQEIILGSNTSNYEVNSLFLPDRSLYSHSIRKIRQFPDRFGTATCIEACSNKEIEVLAEEFIRKLNLIGFTNIEFKYSEEDQAYYYIETNTRVWQQINFSASIGINFPMLYYNYLTNNQVDENLHLKKQGKWIDIAPDLLYFLRYRKLYRFSFLTWLISIFPVRSSGLFSFSDPYPFLKEYNYGLRLFKRKKDN